MSKSQTDDRQSRVIESLDEFFEHFQNHIQQIIIHPDESCGQCQRLIRNGKLTGLKAMVEPLIRYRIHTAKHVDLDKQIVLETDPSCEFCKRPLLRIE